MRFGPAVTPAPMNRTGHGARRSDDAERPRAAAPAVRQERAQLPRHKGKKGHSYPNTNQNQPKPTKANQNQPLNLTRLVTASSNQYPATMFVYGFKCSSQDLHVLPRGTIADYYIEYGLLVFPAYSKPTTLQANGRLTPEFWDQVGRILAATKPVAVTLEHPFITETEDAAIKSVPGAYLDWYHVPRIVTPDMAPVLDVD